MRVGGDASRGRRRILLRMRDIARGSTPSRGSSRPRRRIPRPIRHGAGPIATWASVVASHTTNRRFTRPFRLRGSREAGIVDSHATPAGRNANAGSWPMAALRGRHRVPADRERPGLPEDDAARWRRPVIEPEPRPAVERGCQCGLRLEPREVDADACVRALRERDVGPCVRPRDVETVRIRERRGVSVGRRQRDDDEITLRDRRASDLRIDSGVPVDATAAGSSRSDSSMAFVTSERSARSASICSGFVSRCQNSEVVSPSLVSMPPNIITAASETTSSGAKLAVA